MRKVKPIIHHHHIEIRKRGGGGGNGNTCAGTHEVLIRAQNILKRLLFYGKWNADGVLSF